jgi:glycosyltransferase involved in cell wall biosynthesis
MKLLFVQGGAFLEVEGKYYHGGGLTSTVWNDYYLPFFDNINVVGRYTSNKQLKADLSSTGGLNFTLISGYTSLFSFFPDYFKIKYKLKKEILETDITAVRLNGILGYVAIPILLKYHRLFFVEVVGNVFESYWHHGSITGKIGAFYLDYLNKKYVKKSPYVIYVAKKLKNDYPTNGYDSVISDVELEHILLPNDMQVSRFTSRVFKIGLTGSFLAKYKGQDILLKAISLLDKNIRKKLKLYFLV